MDRWTEGWSDGSIPSLLVPQSLRLSISPPLCLSVPPPLHYRSGDGDGTVHVARTGAWGGCGVAERYLQPWRSSLRDDHGAAAVRGGDERRSGCGNPGARAAAPGAVRARSSCRVAADRGEGAAQREGGSLRDSERPVAGSEGAERGDGARNEGAAWAPAKGSPHNRRRPCADDSGRCRHGYLQIDWEAHNPLSES